MLLPCMYTTIDNNKNELVFNLVSAESCPYIHHTLECSLYMCGIYYVKESTNRKNEYTMKSTVHHRQGLLMSKLTEKCHSRFCCLVNNHVCFIK